MMIWVNRGGGGAATSVVSVLWGAGGGLTVQAATAVTSADIATMTRMGPGTVFRVSASGVRPRFRRSCGGKERRTVRNLLSDAGGTLDMPKVYGVKEKDQVVDHIIDMILSGQLRTGDRIDRTRITKELGLSRIPVQEAILQLEHDGILSTRYHRGAFVARFDEATIREHHELYGILTGIVAARAATNPTPRILAHLDSSLRTFRTAADSHQFQQACWAYRTTLNEEYAGPRLQAAIRASQSFVPNSFWKYPDNQADFGPIYEEEIAAIRRGDPEAARMACDKRAERMAKIMIDELTASGVLGA
ncbi:GntR family transcriptional regulator [Mycolicibacterium elephantis]|uniref:GntR family transcriptional regulator n=1 Tax=Mycolicibacterium elephantis TaxID=81858 RepID=UPI0038995D08